MIVPKKIKSREKDSDGSRSASPASHSFIPQPSSASSSSSIPLKGIRTPRPVSIPQIPSPVVNAKSSVILRNKNTSNATQQQTQPQVQQQSQQRYQQQCQQPQSILNKIRFFRSGAQTLLSDNQSMNGKVTSANCTCTTTVTSKRTSGSSGFGSTISDSSSSLCGDTYINHVPIMNNKSKPSAIKTVKNCILNNNNGNLILLKAKKSPEETTVVCDNNNTKLNSNTNTNSIGKSVPNALKRSIPPPRSRPSSNIYDTAAVPTQIANCSQSVSNSSLPSLSKPTAAVKGTTKICMSEDQSNRVSPSVKMETHREKTHDVSARQSNNQQHLMVTKPEPSIAMVSPIMTRERRAMVSRESKELKFEKKVTANGKEKESKDKSKENICDAPSTSGESESFQKQSQETQHAESSHGESSASNSDVDAALVNIKPMEPLMRTSQFASLRSNANSSSYYSPQYKSRFPNNYSAIENGYTSDCALLGSRRCRHQRSSGQVSADGYISESGISSAVLCSSQIRANQISSPKIGFMSAATHHNHHYQGEDKHSHEIRKLRRELEHANEKVSTLTSQLNTNAHMVAAFEQSLSSMTSRLQQLTASAEQKDSELDRLKCTIEALKKQGIGVNDDTTKTWYGSRIGIRPEMQLSIESISSNSSGGGDGTYSKALKKKTKSKLPTNANGGGVSGSGSSWLRTSFTRAFKKSKNGNKRGSISDAESTTGICIDEDSTSVPNSPLMSLKTSYSSPHADSTDSPNDLNEPENMRELRRQLREKDMTLTDIRLESLTSAHQLENLKEIVNQLRAEIVTLKQDNDRLKRLMSNKSLASSQSSMISNGCAVIGNSNCPVTGNDDDKQSVESLEIESVTNTLLCEGGKRATIGCGTHIIASIIVTPKTKWDQLDLMVKRCFKDHLNRIDPGLGLGLSLDALACYSVGTEKVERQIIISNINISSASSPSSSLPKTAQSLRKVPTPELLPYGYLVNESHISLQFKSAADSLVFDTLIPKPIIQRFLGLLNEHRRIILCGPSGTGKTYLAHKLAEYLSIKSAADGVAADVPIDGCPMGSIATFTVDHKSSKELRAYLSNVAEQCESETVSQYMPSVIILDNLHHVGSIGEVFNGFLNVKYTKCPYIIGTMNQTCSATNLQMNHNFRWVLCANHLEPVRGLLLRCLRRKLIETEVKMANNNLMPNNELTKVIDWIPKLWNHLNQFLETHSSTDVTIGPRLFLSCPIDVSASQVWFTDLWNYSIVPYVTEATREGIQMYGRRSQFVDPSDWVCQTYPWSSTEWVQNLLHIRAEDVNYDSNIEASFKCDSSANSSDPLLNMLMRLQEAANYSNSSQSNQSMMCRNESMINNGFESNL